jgi:hypothetical protein
MSEYKIHKWDVVLSGSSNQQTPMIHINPDLPLLQFIRDNNYAVMCQVAGTGTVYDGKMIPGVVSASADVPSCRPNFFKESGLYVVKLRSNWHGYPDQLGGVKFFGTHGKSDSSEEQKHHAEEHYKPTDKNAPRPPRPRVDDSCRHSAPEVSKDRSTSTSSGVTSSPPKGKGLSTMAILAIIVGGIVVILLLALLLWHLHKDQGENEHHNRPRGAWGGVGQDYWEQGKTEATNARHRAGWTDE